MAKGISKPEAASRRQEHAADLDELPPVLERQISKVPEVKKNVIEQAHGHRPLRGYMNTMAECLVGVREDGKLQAQCGCRWFGCST